MRAQLKSTTRGRKQMNLKTPDIVIQTLASLGVDHLFHLPGTTLTSFYGSLSRQKKIKSVLFKHEQAACFAAAGYSLVTNRPGVCMVMAGPGVTNLISSVTECYYQSIPIVIMTADYPRKNLGREEFHEVDSFAMLAPVTKKIFHPEKIEDLQKAVADALRTATTGRPGPVYLNIPINLMGQATRVKDVRFQQKPCRPSISQIRKTLKLISASQAPVIFAGSGVIRSGAEKELAEFVNLTGIPIFTSLGGRGSIPEGKPLVIGMPSYTFDIDFLNTSDLFIVLGTRLNPVNLRLGRVKVPKRLVQVDLDNPNPKFRKADIYIKSDVKEFLTSLNHTIKKSPHYQKPSKSRIYETYKKSYHDFKATEHGMILKDPLRLTSKRFLLELATFLEKRDATLFSDSIWIPYSHLLPRVRKTRSFFSIRSFGCLGFALPAAIGASLADQKRRIVSLSGDGSFLFNCQELSTAANYRLKNFIQIVLNNSGFSSLHRFASSQFNKQKDYYLWNRIDYHGFSESLGVKTITITSPSKITGALTKAFSGNGPFCINVMTTDQKA
jgi:acetolactate synthase-1/2/3 large subunit